MPPKVDQATIIVLDVGRNVSATDEKVGKSFFHNARECTARIIEKKIMSQANHLVGIVLLGSKKTDNNMAKQYPGAYKHIQMHVELQTPSWQMIRNLPDMPSKSKGDWFDSLIVAADYFKNGISGVKILNTKIILMTNFQSPTNANMEDVDVALDGFKTEKFEIDVIGPNIDTEFGKGDDLELAKRFVEETNGVTATFDDVMHYLLFHKKKAVNAMPWNVDLKIGPNIKIPVSSYIRLKDEPVVKKWGKAIKDPVTSTASTTEGVMKQKILINDETKAVVDFKDIIKGYYYGQQIIPFSDNDKSMLYQSGEKSLSVYGFTHATNINWQNLNGNGTSYVFGRKGDKKAQYAIRCFVECLHELNMVAIVRRVYNNGNAPKMYALMPVIDSNNFICLSMVALCFKEEIKNMAFPPTNLKKYSCSDEQVNAFKDLIKAMDLTKAYDETYDDAEAFPIAETVSPTAQYVLDCIAFRAMNPGKPLPQPRDDIMMLFKVPSSIDKRSREPLEKIKKLFTLKKVETKTRNKKDLSNNTPIKPETTSPNNIALNNDMPKVQLPTIKKTNEVHRIGTIDPIGDFKTLRNKGKALVDLSSQMTEAIENIVNCNLDGNYAKAFETMMFFRTQCVNGDPSPYNIWLQKYRSELIDRKKMDVINMIYEKKLNFILKDENSLSTYDENDSHEDSQLYENDTIPNSTDLIIKSDVNDMFDDM